MHPEVTFMPPGCLSYCLPVFCSIVILTSEAYSDTREALRRNGMEPMATLHHFVHPQWFEELGAFERQENISLFLDWVRLAFE